ncbi:MAG: hypothetical protein ACR2NP_13385, partial [Pirellulaceae bacterium]
MIKLFRTLTAGFAGLLVPVLLLSAIGCPLYAQEAPQQSDDLQSRLELLKERLEAERVKLHIPGFAIAIVKD